MPLQLEAWKKNILFKVKAPYNLNKLTSNAIVKAIGNNKKKNEFVKYLNDEKTKLINELKKINSVEKVYPTETLLLLALKIPMKYLII